MKPPLWLILHAAHASMASTEQLFLLVTEPRSGSDWLVDLCVTASRDGPTTAFTSHDVRVRTEPHVPRRLDAHPNVCVPAGAWPEKHSGEKHSGVDGQGDVSLVLL